MNLTDEGWEHIAEKIHVVPVNDLREHETDGKKCWCKPRLSTENENIIIHNSMDRREEYENGRPKH